MKRSVTLLAALLVLGCAQPDRRQAAFNAYEANLQADVQGGKITSKQAVALARDRARELFNDPLLNELWAYRVMLADQVERGTTTLEQAEYLDVQKSNELMERAKAEIRATRPPTPVLAPRQEVRCYRDALGGMVCR